MADAAREEGVTTDSPPVADLTTPDTSTGQTDVVIGDRPEKNLKAEFDRKFDLLRQELAQMQALIQRPTPTVQSVQSGQKEQSDQELLDLARQGSNEAYQQYMSRQIRKELRTENEVRDRAQVGFNQANLLVQKYPVFKDSTHPLTQTATLAKNLLIQAGRPNDYETIAEAMKTAIADNPEIIAQLVGKPGQVRETVRQSAVSGQTGVEGSAPRASAPSKPSQTVSPREVAIAKRMGIKDAAKAKENWLKRHADKQVSLSPTIIASIEQEGK